MYDFRCTCLNERVDNRPEFIIGKRRQGKTALLIKQASETDGVIVCPSPNMADNVFGMAQSLGYSICRPITYDASSLHSKGRRTKGYYFDEYGMLLKSLISREINNLESDNVKTVIIDEESISQLNDILGGLKVCDMDGKKLRLKVEICEED